MGACLSMFGLAVVCLAFGAATRNEGPEDAPAVENALASAKTAPAERFFVAPAATPAMAYQKVPIEALLLQLENHVRLEQAAAESFLRAPGAELLHSRTMSPLVN
jgi:hypothetical protein